MGRPPKPDEVKRLEGYPGHHPIRQPSLVGGRIASGDSVETPAGLSPAERKAWAELTEPLIRGGILDRADLSIVEMAAVALARARHARRVLAKEGITHTGSQGLAMHPAITVEKGAMAEYRQLASLLGIGPASRARLGKGTAPEGGMGGELARTLPSSARLRVVNGDPD